jgi:hypothetical protein
MRLGQDGLGSSSTQQPVNKRDRVPYRQVPSIKTFENSDIQRGTNEQRDVLILVRLELPERCTARHVVVWPTTLWGDQSSLEYQMSKRKPATASKHAHSPRTAAKAHRAAQDIVRSAKDSVSHSVDTGSTEPPSERHDNPEQDALLVEHLEAIVGNTEQEALLVTDNNSKKGIDLSSANASVRAYQAKLLEIAQTNMQFAFEFAQRLATIRSPIEFPSVIAEFTSRRIRMFSKHSAEMAELNNKRWTF